MLLVAVNFGQSCRAAIPAQTWTVKSCGPARTEQVAHAVNDRFSMQARAYAVARKMICIVESVSTAASTPRVIHV